MEDFLQIFKQIANTKVWRSNSLQTILKKYPKDGKGLYRHDELVESYKQMVKNNQIDSNKTIEERIKMKPTRTQSGVATITVLMKPYPCPGQCIFCPSDRNMPKSYISSEPGAQRALTNKFDPFDQTKNRIQALQNIGHSTDKIELIILGGTCSFYPQKYQLWFVKRCFDAMNSFDKKYVVDNVEEKNITDEDLFYAHTFNETTLCRNVGLVFETRPDYITKEEILRLRKLGATKIQIGIQNLNDNVLKLNKRGHSTNATKKAFQLLRLAGFKIHGHIMPNLYGSTLKKDVNDYKKLWTKDYYPDELKIYPTSIIPNTKLEELYINNKYLPYTYDQLLEYFVKVLPITPKNVRLTRIIRDIPSNEIVAGNKATNFRQIAEERIKDIGLNIVDIRSREIRDRDIKLNDLNIDILKYNTSTGKEYFISYITKNTDQICGFLRLSLPKRSLSKNHFISELKNNSIIREVHVYGTLVNIGDTSSGESQHLGLGRNLIQIAEDISKENGYKSISVISAIGTREYYKKRGFKLERLYMSKPLS